MKFKGMCISCGGVVAFDWDKPLTQVQQNQIATTIHDRSCIESKRFINAYGSCIYCGQVHEINCLYNATQEVRNDIATHHCNCYEAETAREREEQIANAQERIQRLFGEECETLGFKPIIKEDVFDIMNTVVVLISNRKIRSSTIEITGRIKAKITLSTKGKINVERAETSKCKLEE